MTLGFFDKEKLYRRVTKRSQLSIAAGLIILSAVLAYRLISSPNVDAPEGVSAPPDTVASETEEPFEIGEAGLLEEEKQEPELTGAPSKVDEVSFDPNNSLAAAERVKFVNSPDLPSGIAFRQVAVVLKSDLEDGGSSGSDWLQERMDISAEEAELIVEAVNVAKSRSDDELTRTAYEMLCEGEVPKVYGDDAYPVLQEYEDLEGSIPGVHLETVYEELGEPLSSKFEALLDEIKLTTTHIKYDQKAAFELMPISVDQVLARNCLAMHAKLN